MSASIQTEAAWDSRWLLGTVSLNIFPTYRILVQGGGRLGLPGTRDRGKVSESDLVRRVSGMGPCPASRCACPVMVSPPSSRGTRAFVGCHWCPGLGGPSHTDSSWTDMRTAQNAVALSKFCLQSRHTEYRSFPGTSSCRVGRTWVRTRTHQPRAGCAPPISDRGIIIE